MCVYIYIYIYARARACVCVCVCVCVILKFWHAFQFLGAIEKLRKSTIKSVMSDCLSIPMEEIGSQ